MSEALVLPHSRFVNLVKQVTEEVLQEHRGNNHVLRLRYERDAIVALQMMAEHILTMVFEMTY